jgi:intracellular sulfur oxidation DsrE/DsrF family protein
MPQLTSSPPGGYSNSCPKKWRIIALPTYSIAEQLSTIISMVRTGSGIHVFNANSKRSNVVEELEANGAKFPR